MKIVLLPGDGIGPEVTGAAREILAEIAPDLELEEHVFGGAAILSTGTPLPGETLAACTASDAVLLGAVGLPQFDAAEVRPEQGLLGLRKSLGVYANLRPAAGGKIDLLVVRELVGGLYFGARGTREDGTVFDTMEYHPDQVTRIARRAFELARGRRGRVCSVDKANVLDTSRMWRRVVTEVGGGYPDVELEHLLVDTAAMRLVTDPQHFDVILTENMFGDILSDEASARHRRARARGVGQSRRRRPGDLRAGARIGSRHRRTRDREPCGDAPLGRADARPRARPARRCPPARGGRRHGTHPRPDSRSRRSRDHGGCNCGDARRARPLTDHRFLPTLERPMQRADAYHSNLFLAILGARILTR